MYYADFRFTGCERTFREDDDEDTKLKRPTKPLLPLHDLLVGESFRRRMEILPNVLDMMAYGFVTPDYKVPVVLTVEEQRVWLRKRNAGVRDVKVGLEGSLEAIKGSMEKVRGNENALMGGDMDLD